MNCCKLRLSLIVLILAIIVSSNYCFGKDDVTNEDNSTATNTENNETSEKGDDIVASDQDSNSLNVENTEEGENKEEKKETENKENENKEVENKGEGNKEERDKEENKEENNKEDENKEEKNKEDDNKEEKNKEEDNKEVGNKENKEEEEKEKKVENDKIQKFEENTEIEDGITDNKGNSDEGPEIAESQEAEDKKESGDGEQQGSIHTSIMEGLYKLDYKLKFLRRMLRKDKKMIIQIHALGYLVDSIKEQIVRDVAALNSVVKMEAENASELNKLQSIHDNHVNDKLDFIKHENIVQVNN
ncbi:uncharacterized protein cubi_02226 [Cryptosporidium ubiquitum]|uniref:Uncharacterized protein n=1 Tax=Cryptosporidium ubiquitum TaxID=857276 RepID=A0A1J4MHR1_9CRYT|nr:uncharacterized protein cubi_02226 [Cryptosporidium ubiquitum]OII72995.1 hypothetical protein cubi_02226 [Cryptosporidium ubiquitum]